MIWPITSSRVSVCDSLGVGDGELVGRGGPRVGVGRGGAGLLGRPGEGWTTGSGVPPATTGGRVADGPADG